MTFSACCPVCRYVPVVVGPVFAVSAAAGSSSFPHADWCDGSVAPGPLSRELGRSRPAESASCPRCGVQGSHLAGCDLSGGLWP